MGMQWGAIEKEYPLEGFLNRADRLNFLITHATLRHQTGFKQAWFGHCGQMLVAEIFSNFSGKPAWVYSFDKFDGGDFRQHGDEMTLVFQRPVSQVNTYIADGVHGNFSSESIDKMSHMFGAYWTQFAKNLDPNGDSVPHWTPYNADVEKVLIINDTYPTLAVPPYASKCAFWQDLFANRGESTPHQLRGAVQ